MPPNWGVPTVADQPEPTASPSCAERHHRADGCCHPHEAAEGAALRRALSPAQRDARTERAAGAPERASLGIPAATCGGRSPGASSICGGSPKTPSSRKLSASPSAGATAGSFVSSSIFSHRLRPALGHGQAFVVPKPLLQGQSSSKRFGAGEPGEKDAAAPGEGDDAREDVGSEAQSSELKLRVTCGGSRSRDVDQTSRFSEVDVETFLLDPELDVCRALQREAASEPGFSEELWPAAESGVPGDGAKGEARSPGPRLAVENISIVDRVTRLEQAMRRLQDKVASSGSSSLKRLSRSASAATQPAGQFCGTRNEETRSAGCADTELQGALLSRGASACVGLSECSEGERSSFSERFEELLAQKVDATQLREKADVSLVNRVSSAVQRLQHSCSQKEKLLQDLTQAMPSSVQRMRDILGKTLISVKELREAVHAEEQRVNEIEASQRGIEERWQTEMKDMACKILCQNHEVEHCREEMKKGIKQISWDHQPRIEQLEQQVLLKSSNHALNDLAGRLQAVEIAVEGKPCRQDIAELVVQVMNQNSLKLRGRNVAAKVFS